MSTENTKDKPTIAADVEQAEKAGKQLLAQLLEQAKQPEGPDGVSFSQKWANERDELVRHFVGKTAFPNPPAGKTTAQMGDAFYGQEIDTIYSEYGDNMRLHRQRLREGWVPVVDPSSGEHVQDRYGSHLYKRSIQLRKAQDKAMREMREKRESAGDIAQNDLAKASLSEGVTHDETSIKRGG